MSTDESQVATDESQTTTDELQATTEKSQTSHKQLDKLQTTTYESIRKFFWIHLLNTIFRKDTVF